MATKKTLIVEYFLIPTPESELVSDYMYRSISDNGDWRRRTLQLSILKDNELFSKYILDFVSEFGYSKVKAYECKLVRRRK